MIHDETKRTYGGHPAAGAKIGAIALLIAFAAVGCFGQGKADSIDSVPMNKPADAIARTQATETAVLAGGCFWGVEAVFERLEGVLDVVSGYAGGEADTAQYQKVGSGTTGHAEAVRVVYDPELIQFEVLLDVFFKVAHDPTQLNYQGPDVGTQYRSAVFYASDEQKRITEQSIRELTAEKGSANKPVVTQVVPLEEFYPAEEYHQDFMRLNPRHPYILYWDLPKVAHLEKAYPELLAGQR